MTEPTGHTERLESALAGRYKVKQTLGEGGMATVYLAEDIKHERSVALKILKPELAAVIGAERFLAEIKTTANLQHPHILPLFDSGEADGYLYYVMPFIDGETLEDRIDREQQLGVEEAVRIARDVADALDYAHRSGVIHRDIKPANILLHDGRPVVADFGIALAISAAGGGRMTETGLSLGTPHYMSPEQASADRDLSARSDVYSLGCVLYEMLAGQPPHTGPSAQSILVRILTEDPRDVTELRRTVPPNVAATVMKSIEKLPADRFDSAKDFIESLDDETFTYQAATRALSAAGPATRAASPTASPGSRGAAAGLAAAILFAGLAAWGWLRPGPAVVAEPATLARLDLEDLNVPQNEKVVISPDGSRLAVVSRVAGVRSLWVRNVDEETFRMLWDGGDPRRPVFSPEGDWIAYEDDDAIMKIALSGGAPRVVVAKSAADAPDQLDWGDDGTIIFDGRGGLYRVSETGGEPMLVLADVQADNMRLLPGGHGVVWSESESFTTYYTDLASDTTVMLVPGGVAPAYVETGHLLYVDEQGGLWALPFDVEAGEATGDATPIMQGVYLTFRTYARFDVSRTGTLVYGLGGDPTGGGPAGAAEMVVVDLDGDERVLPLPPRVIRELRWAPDGERVAYSGTEAGAADGPLMIYEYNVELGTTPRRLTSEGSYNGRPAWSPDGTRIAFSSTRARSQSRDLYVKNVYDDSAPDLIFAAPGRSRPDQWLEDDLLVFTTGTSGAQNNSWTMHIPDSTTAAPYIAAEGNRMWSRVAPQRDFATYESDESGRFEVYVRSFPVARQPSPVSTGGGVRPQWAPDGNTIYYWRQWPGADSLFAAHIQREPAFAVLSTDFVLAGDYQHADDWDLHPDGDRFITARLFQTGRGGPDAGVAGEAERHLIVTNWFTELLTAVGTGGGR